VRIAGYFLAGLALSSVFLTLVASALDGEPFYGRNVYGLAVDPYVGLAIFAVVGVVGVIWLVQRINKAIRR
jgi:hypothetical protein